MYKQNPYQETSINVYDVTEGETIEQKLERVVNSNEPIEDGAPPIYTQRDEGVNPDYDIRTDKWEHAVEAMDVVSKTDIAKREERRKAREDALKGLNEDGKAESAESTQPTN